MTRTPPTLLRRPAGPCRFIGSGMRAARYALWPSLTRRPARTRSRARLGRCSCRLRRSKFVAFALCRRALPTVVSTTSRAALTRAARQLRSRVASTVRCSRPATGRPSDARRPSYGRRAALTTQQSGGPSRPRLRCLRASRCLRSCQATLWTGSTFTYVPPVLTPARPRRSRPYLPRARIPRARAETLSSLMVWSAGVSAVAGLLEPRDAYESARWPEELSQAARRARIGGSQWKQREQSRGAQGARALPCVSRPAASNAIASSATSARRPAAQSAPATIVKTFDSDQCSLFVVIFYLGSGAARVSLELSLAQRVSLD